MVTLVQLRDAVALAGVIELQALVRQFNLPSSLLSALLERLIALGKIEKVEDGSELTVSGCSGCSGCHSVTRCHKLCYYRYLG